MAAAVEGGYLVTKDRPRIRYCYGSAKVGDIIPAEAARLLRDFEALSADGTLRYFSTYAEARDYRS